ncbi:EscU/YscU/HrcU family type III secretion system export apparatus switch protein [Microbacterium sp.]|uniref:EscU/YscU/HrcU family type III secretion system export apparatus switch protein n=1 Tax=Microbacterium sp. TaxID=51671 RepID=UPI003A8E7E44
MSTADSGERTEKATDRRLREARQKGQLSRSQDLTAWMGIGAAALCLPAAIAMGASAGTEQLIRLSEVVREPTPSAALTALDLGLGSILATIGPLLVTVAVITLFGAVAQGGVHLRRFSGRVDQFNVIKGLGRLFGGRALWEGAKALLKTAVIATAVALVIAGLMPVLSASGAHSVAQLLQTASSGVGALLQATVGAGLALAAIDVFVVMRRNTKHTRMTKREVRDESKNSEGDPLIRQQRRSRQVAMSRNRMIAAVADADVVVVNPTHIAVALRYEPGRSAPRVVAKGAGVIAERIRQRATDVGVAMVRDVPLARALHAGCEVGAEIPESLYTAVAHVLVFVDALRRRGAARGIHSLPPRRTA